MRQRRDRTTRLKITHSSRIFTLGSELVGCQAVWHIGEERRLDGNQIEVRKGQLVGHQVEEGGRSGVEAEEEGGDASATRCVSTEEHQDEGAAMVARQLGGCP